MPTSRRQILAGLAGLPLMLGSQAAWAGAASRIDQFAPDEGLAMIEAEIARIRPSTRGKLRFSGLFGWQNVGLIGGCRHMFAPGQVTRFGKAMIEPFRQLHFAGEHTRRADFGMEAALESGERSAIEVMEQVG